jgi:hypothetical protein
VTDKEELIKAAETLKSYCKGWHVDCDEDCILSEACNYLYDFDNISDCMKCIIDSVRYSDD